MLFNGAMVRALLDGSKTQTRRAIKLPHMNPLGVWQACTIGGHDGGRTIAGESVPLQGVIWHTRTGEVISSPYGQPGDRLWVRETFAAILPQDPAYNGGEPIAYDYAATYQHGDRLGDSIGIKKRWTPSIHMPRRASRILLEIVSVRVERLNDISKEDAIAEGIDRVGNNYGNGPAYCDYRARNQEDTAEWFNSPIDSYRTLWESINSAESWAASWAATPWVWVISFKRVAP